MDKCATLEQLRSMFEGRVAAVERALQLKTAAHSDTCQQYLGLINMEMDHWQTLMAAMRTELDKQHDALKQFQASKQKWQQISDRINHAQSNLPARLPQKILQKQPPKAPIPSSLPRPRQNSRGPVSSLETPMSQYPDGVGSTPLPSIKSLRQQLFHPSIEYLTIDEFEVVPKYMKGRSTYDSINLVVEAINKATTEKYTLLTTNKSRRNDKVRQAIRVYKEQENKETKGSHFITEKDIIQFTNLKIDRQFSMVLTILRHCSRIREVRGGGIVRYILCG